MPVCQPRVACRVSNIQRGIQVRHAPTLAHLCLIFSGVFAVFQGSLIQSLRREKEKYPSHYWRVWTLVPPAAYPFSCSPPVATNLARSCFWRSKGGARSSSAACKMLEANKIRAAFRIALPLLIFLQALCLGPRAPCIAPACPDGWAITIACPTQKYPERNLMGATRSARMLAAAGPLREDP